MASYRSLMASPHGTTTATAADADRAFTFDFLNRGYDRRAVLGDDEGRIASLEAPARTKAGYPFTPYADCLMTDHVHFVLRPAPAVSVSRVTRSLTVAHTWTVPLPP